MVLLPEKLGCICSVEVSRNNKYFLRDFFAMRSSDLCDSRR